MTFGEFLKKKEIFLDCLAEDTQGRLGIGHGRGRKRHACDKISTHGLVGGELEDCGKASW
jgi:hypothetical protein